MKNMLSMGLKHEDGQLLILDQQLLPDREVWLPCRTIDDMIASIKALKVRGAPLIGVAAALSLAKFAENGVSDGAIRAAGAALRDARPTAVNLMWAMDYLLKNLDAFGVDGLIQAAEKVFEEDVALCDAIANQGASLISDRDGVLTHCNAGALATAGVGTAVGVIRKAFEQGKRIHVYVDETRPLLQGGRLTAWEMKKLGIPFTVICDNMAADLMRRGKIQKAIVGADRIALNGDFANKIGTYGVAVSASFHQIPFYTAAPYTTVDFECPSGEQIPIEERSGHEVRGAAGAFGEVRWCPEDCNTFNPAFDVTPAHLLSGIVLDRAFVGREELLANGLRRLCPSSV